jgi:hypothetical protein
MNAEAQETMWWTWVFPCEPDGEMERVYRQLVDRPTRVVVVDCGGDWSDDDAPLDELDLLHWRRDCDGCGQ